MSIVFCCIPVPHYVRTDTWRSKWPAAELARRGHDAYYMGPEGETATKGWAYRDTVIIHATNQDVGLSGTVRYLKRICHRVFVQFDDDYTQLGHIQELGQWYFDLKGDQALACRCSDGVIASTPQVAEAYSKWAPAGCWVIRNYLPEWITRVVRVRLDPPVIGWFGDLAAHRRDIEWLGHHARDLRTFGVIGDPDAVAEVTGRDLDHAAGLQRWNDLYGELARFSVGIVPVVDDGFNRPKSWIKPVEFAAVGVPSVACWLPAYEEAATAGLPITFVSDPAEMVTRANQLLSSDAAVSDALRRVVRERFTMEGVGGDAWEKWVAEVGAS